MIRIHTEASAMECPLPSLRAVATLRSLTRAPREVMPVRDFRDAAGREWRGWGGQPGATWPPTRAGGYPPRCLRGGWVLFVTRDGALERRPRPPSCPPGQ